MKQANVQVYAGVLSQVIDSTTQNGSDLNDDFEILRKAVDDNKVADIDTAELTKIQKHFQEGTDIYKENLLKLEKVAVPVKILGRHKQLIKHYEDYTNACQAMTDSINPEANSVVVDMFNQSEKDQEAAIAAISNTTSRIMSAM
ncbi:hypothetical protein OXT66_06165 [Lentilactobacillus senioris]|uniref:hypothetical protein n=1 Tax=Lentilactobacillus senioris TaxID=931534 RepID=UPI0022805B0E|nr:hypothetical protein [Lentilactobacillus senioris]MCY9807119.1 hypothetical protein [Lentilactobacillus senioris]